MKLVQKTTAISITGVFFWWNITFYPFTMSSHIYTQNMPLLLTPILNY